jgi:5-methylcytosine-specific restriction endonuclease McrA
MSLVCEIVGCENLPERNGICSSHNFEARKASREALKPKKNYTIPKISEKKKKALSAKNATYKAMDATTPQHCSGCGSPHMLTHSHIIPVGQYPEFEAVLENIVYDCVRCHDIWEHGTFEQCQQLANYHERIRIIKKLKPDYLHRMLLNSEKTLKRASETRFED